MVLRLWVGVRMIYRSEYICGEETLGMSSDMIDNSSPMHGKILTPPVISVQSDAILMGRILPSLKGMILEQLAKIVLAHKPQNWFCIYLCTFILLHNCSLITRHSIKYAQKHGLKVSTSFVYSFLRAFGEHLSHHSQSRYPEPDLITELHLGANVLLAYFHYCCKGFCPFDLDWDAGETTSMADLDPDQIKFVRRTAEYVQLCSQSPVCTRSNT